MTTRDEEVYEAAKQAIDAKRLKEVFEYSSPFINLNPKDLGMAMSDMIWAEVDRLDLKRVARALPILNLKVGSVLKFPPTGELLIVRQVLSPADVRANFARGNPDMPPFTVNLEACEVVCLEVRDDEAPMGTFEPIHLGLTAVESITRRDLSK